MTHSELVDQGASGVKLRRMVQSGSIQAVGSGIYATVELDPFVAAVLATSKYYPHAVISGISALCIHELAQEYITKIDIDIPRETNIRNKMFLVHRVPSHRLVGCMRLRYYGGKIFIYDKERSLCDAYRLDSGGPLFYKTLKRYVALKEIMAQKILGYDLALKTNVLPCLQQELAIADKLSACHRFEAGNSRISWFKLDK